jgi:hypothetical protein
LCLLVVALPADAAAARRDSRTSACKAAGSRTLVASAQLRVYRVGSDDRRVYACRYRTGRRRLIATYFSCDCSVADEFVQAWLSGRFVAYNTYSCPPPGLGGGCDGSVGSVDSASGREKYGEATGYVSDLELKRNGAFGYIAGGQVRKIDAEGSAVLDPGPGVDPRSLARAESTLYWMRDGEPRAALLR